MKLFNIVRKLELPFSERETLYRYNYYDTLIEFVQNNNNGHIYFVNITPSSELKSFKFYAEDNSIRDFSYPKRIYVRTSKNLFVEDFDDYIETLKLAKKTAEAIESIFKCDKHFSLYKEVDNHG